MKPAYRWRDGAQFKIDANKAGQRIELLQHKHNGAVTPEEVLADAKAETSPLHKAFEWDDSAAAGEYRLGQARQLLAALVIEVKIADGKPAQSSRAFVNVQKPAGQTYVGRTDALADKKLRAQLVETGWRELESWCERHRHLNEFEKIIGLLESSELRFRRTA